MSWVTKALWNARFFIENFLYIRTKDSELIKLKLNSAQKRLLEAVEEQRAAGKPVRIIILKARQLGFSTVTEAMIFHRTAMRENVNSLIVAHRDDSTSNLFKMSKQFLEKLPPALKPMTRSSNAKEILFENPDRDPKRKAKNPGLKSRIRCQTAGGAGIGRSDTIQNVHASEFAFWPGEKRDTWVGIMQAVPATPETMVIIESTANGYEEFQRMWDAAVKGESDFMPLFFPWFENREYRKKPDPDVVWTEKERSLAERYGLDREQLAWRRWCIRNNCAGDEDKFRQEYPSNPEEAFLTSGRPVFDPEKVNDRLQSVGEPIRRGEFVETPGQWPPYHFQERERGCVCIYREPIEGRPYVIGGDTAGEGSDFFTGQVIDNITGGQVAVLRHQYDEDQYARQMYCLGLYYNKALIGVEVNYSTYPVKTLANMGYPRLYVRELPDTYTGGLKKAFGWNTNAKTRPLAVAEAVQMFRTDPALVVDRETLKEMKVFQYNELRRPAAMEGEHDDLVMALCIAWSIRGQQDMTEGFTEDSMDGWSESMKEDYWNADEITRRHLMKIWGRKHG